MRAVIVTHRCYQWMTDWSNTYETLTRPVPCPLSREVPAAPGKRETGKRNQTACAEGVTLRRSIACW